jgi:hypothetical protein
MKNKVIVGIDIGQKGAIVTRGEELGIAPIPIKTLKNGKKEMDISHLCKHIKALDPKPDLIVFEELHSLFKAGKAQTWSLAFQAGALEAVCGALNIPYLKVLPKDWQGVMFKDIPPLRKKTGENDTKAMAEIALRKILPDAPLNFGGKSKNVQDVLVDALLLEEYGRRNYETMFNRSSHR